MQSNMFLLIPLRIFPYTGGTLKQTWEAFRSNNEDIGHAKDKNSSVISDTKWIQLKIIQICCNLHAQQLKFFINCWSIEAADKFSVLGDVTLQPQSSTAKSENTNKEKISLNYCALVPRQE